MSTAIDGGWVHSDATFAARLALVRHRMGWNQKEAALACGIPQATWRNWESGRKPHDLVEVCEAIATRTGANLDWLIKGSRPGGEPMNAGYSGDNQAITWDAA